MSEKPYVIQNKVKEILKEKGITPEWLRIQMNERGVKVEPPRMTNIINSSRSHIKSAEIAVIADILKVSPVKIMPSIKGTFWNPETKELFKIK